MKAFAIILVLLAVLIGITACDDDFMECTTEFASVKFRVVDSAGAPVDSLTITVTNARTDEIYDIRQPSYEVGLYFALDDGCMTKIRSYGDPILVHGARGNLEFDAEFLIGADDCHVEKLAGPEVVVIDDP